MGGQPLDSGTRSFMEAGFGQSFCHVRVHTDSVAAGIAAAEGAQAFTAGHHVVFAAGGYRPDTRRGATVLAHELAHVVQQRDAVRREGAPETHGMERAADLAATSVMQGQRAHVPSAARAPHVQFLKVTTGALGKALEPYTNNFHVPDRAITLLQHSPTFMKLASAIDGAYVWRGDSYKRNPLPTLDASGRLADGPFKGKRELADVQNGPAEFEPQEAPPEPGRGKIAGDSIQLTGTTTPEFIQQLAHEITHAANFIGASAPPPATLIASIDASIKDEVAARTSEAKILGEVPSKQVRARVQAVGSTVPAEVERDVSPAFGMTYRENAFFAFHLGQAQTDEKLTEAEAEAIRTEVEKAITSKQTVAFVLQPNVGANGLYNISKYADVWFDRRMAQVEWKALFDRYAPGTPPQAEQEAMLQDHARRFFRGQAAYTPLSMPLPSTTP